MDRGWIDTPRTRDAYKRGVEKFIYFAQCNVVSNHNRVRIRYHCVNCLNGRILNISKIRKHLLCDGFLENYTTWTWHNELLHLPRLCGASKFVDFSMDDRLEDMICDVGAESFTDAVFENISNDAETPLYPSSTNFTRLTVLKLVNLKAINAWTDKRFIKMLQLLKDMLQEGNTLPNQNYVAKKILCLMGMDI